MGHTEAERPKEPPGGSSQYVVSYYSLLRLRREV